MKFVLNPQVKAHFKKRLKLCVICGTEFVSNPKKQFTCTSVCSGKRQKEQTRIRNAKITEARRNAKENNRQDKKVHR